VIGNESVSKGAAGTEKRRSTAGGSHAICPEVTGGTELARTIANAAVPILQGSAVALQLPGGMGGTINLGAPGNLGPPAPAAIPAPGQGAVGSPIAGPPAP